MRANEGNSPGIGTVLLGLVAIALAGMAGTIGLINQVNELGPTVGDIVAFDPLDQMARDMTMRIDAIRADSRAGATCVLDVRAMHASGGSLIVEAREPGPGFGYRVHWAGARSSDGPQDCGSSAELLVKRMDVESLALAAGGYGVPAQRRISLLRPSPDPE